jgi:uncharacterized membrane protein
METALWYLPCLSAHLFWVIGTYIDKYLLDSYQCDDPNVSAVGTFVLVSSAFMIVVALIMFGVTLGLGTSVLNFSREEIFLAILIGVCDIAWLIPYLYALEDDEKGEEGHGRVVQVDPLFPIVPVFGFLFGYFLFDESYTLVQVLAALTILAGSVVININLQKREGAQARGVLNTRVLLLMGLSSMIIAISGYFFEDATTGGDFWGIAFWVSVGSVCAGLVIYVIVPSYRRGFNAYVKRRDAQSIAVNTVNELCDNIAGFAFYAAIMYGPSTALVQSTMAYQPLAVFVIGFLIMLRKRETMRGGMLAVRFLAIGFIVSGSYFLYYNEFPAVNAPVVTVGIPTGKILEGYGNIPLDFLSCFQ